MKNLCTICVRSGSKGVRNKNIKLMHGKPLIVYTIEQAKSSKLFSQITVSSDSDEILKIAKKFDVDILIKRDPSLCEDHSGKVDAIRDALLRSEDNLAITFDNVIDLDVTSPLRNADDIVNSFKLFTKNNSDNLITGCMAKKNPYFNMVEIKKGPIQYCKNSTQKPLSRQESPVVYEMNASIYIWKREKLIKTNNLLGEKTSFFEMPEERSIDIDTELDWEIVSGLMKKKICL